MIHSKITLKHFTATNDALLKAHEAMINTPALLVPIHVDGLVVDHWFNADHKVNQRADVSWQQADPFHEKYEKRCVHAIKEIGARGSNMRSPCYRCDGNLQKCYYRYELVRPTPFEGEPSSSAEAVVPKPFNAAKFSLREGVHLHWSMPDGLTKGYGLDNGLDDDASFPHLPNRWLVIRAVASEQLKNAAEEFENLRANYNGKKQQVKGWVIIADGGQEMPAVNSVTKRANDFGDFTRIGTEPELPLYHRVVDLDDYDEKKCHRLGDEPLTAVSSGDPSGIVFYDSCYDQFGFHDDMADLEDGDVNYQVYGWYAGESSSPFAKVHSAESLKRRLAQFQWTVGLDLNQEMAVAAGEESEIGSSDDLIDSRSWAFGCGLICHGSLFNVKWGSVRHTDRRPSGRDFFIGIGGSAEGAASAVLVGGDDGASARYGQLLAGFMDGSLAEIGNENNLASFRYLAHKRTFASLDGGTISVPVSDSTIESLDRVRSDSQYGIIQYANEARERQIAQGISPYGREYDLLREQLSTAHTQYQTSTGSIVPLAFNGETAASDAVSAVQQKAELDVNAFDVRSAIVAKYEAGYAMGNRQGLEKQKMIDKPLPRYYQSKDPVIVIGGAGRGVKHGEDGRFDSENRLVCRFANDVVTSVDLAFASSENDDVFHSLSVAGEDVVAVDSQKIPGNVRSLIYESCLFNPVSAQCFPELVRSRIGSDAAVNVTHLIREYKRQVCEKPQYLVDKKFADLVDARDDRKDTTRVNRLDAAMKTFAGNGRLPSPHGLRAWEQPWTPVHLEWLVDFIPGDVALDGWFLNGVDYDLKGAFTSGSRTFQLTGRSILTPGFADILLKAIDRSLEVEKDDDFIPDDLENGLDDISDIMRKIDLLGTSFAGFNEFLLGEIEEMYSSHADVDRTPRVKAWLRSGRLKIKQLRVVDSFGRYIDRTDFKMGQIVGSDEFFDEEADGSLILPPRITPPARLTFRFLDSEYDGILESKEGEGTTGICGWCMPDHLDNAMEFFDTAGNNVGQLRLNPSLDLTNDKGAGFGVLWEGSPGEGGSYGGTLETAALNRHMGRMVEGIRSFNAQDKMENEETALSALMRVIDANCWNIDPLGRTGSDHMSVLLGKPLAIVRAKLTFDVKVAEGTEMDEGYEEFLRIPFPVLIGSLKDQTDGVMGFFINDDYSTFHPASPAVVDSTLYNGNTSWKGANSVEIRKVDHPFICKEHGLTVRPGQTVVLTILVDPRGGIHATSGILPQKRLDLIQEEVKPALDTMAVTFMIGPVLVDPKAVRMPHPSEITGNWSWLHRSSPVVWQDDQITPADDRARFSGNGVEAHEGWLKFSGGVGKNS